MIGAHAYADLDQATVLSQLGILDPRTSHSSRAIPAVFDSFFFQRTKSLSFRS
jgi:hypothetical protein